MYFHFSCGILYIIPITMNSILLTTSYQFNFFRYMELAQSAVITLQNAYYHIFIYRKIIKFKAIRWFKYRLYVPLNLCRLTVSGNLFERAIHLTKNIPSKVKTSWSTFWSYVYVFTVQKWSDWTNCQEIHFGWFWTTQCIWLYLCTSHRRSTKKKNLWLIPSLSYSRNPGTRNQL